MTAYSGFVVPERDARRHAAAELPWLSDGVIIASQLGTAETTAIVHPCAFTTAMMNAAQSNGAELRRGQVTGIVRCADGSTVEGVEVDGGVIEADAVVVAIGPWSVIAAKWMSLPEVFGQRSPSLVYDTGTDVPADALFLEYHEESGALVTGEVFPRANGNTLITAFSDQAPLPFDPAAVAPESGEIDRLQAICERLSPIFRAQRIIARQACSRRRAPVSRRPKVAEVRQRLVFHGKRDALTMRAEAARRSKSAGDKIAVRPRFAQRP